MESKIIDTEVTSWEDDYTGKKCYALRVYINGWLQWQSEICATDEAARRQIDYFYKEYNINTKSQHSNE